MPLQLAEAFMQQVVVGKVSHDCLVQSFLMLLHERERDIIQKAIHGTDPFPTDELRDIFCGYGTTVLASRENIEQVVSQVANTELVTKQFACIMKVIRNDISAEEIKAVYSCCSPTFSNVSILRTIFTTGGKSFQMAHAIFAEPKPEDFISLHAFLYGCRACPS